ncbi:serine acetyltransferase [bacterium]|nr:serine acetyltransferase [bacterium]|tara:strand:+ start:1492 stop:2340 length:849 start_codon:yes stop_codon:yes gene_type:complete
MNQSFDTFDTADTAACEAIISSYNTYGGIMDDCPWPSKSMIESLLMAIRNLLFPGYFDPNPIRDIRTTTLETLATIRSLLHTGLTDTRLAKTSGQAHAVVDQFFQYIPTLRSILKTDQMATFDGCPAANHPDEVIVAYPGFWAILVYRVAHFLYQQGVPFIPRVMTEIAHSDTGIDIHPQATIGGHCFIDHGTGIVIGQTARIGQHVSLYQGVTIGALRIPRRGNNANEKRHPTIEDSVTIYARTTILGGDTVIGAQSIIGGNLWITASVPAKSRLVNKAIQ